MFTAKIITVSDRSARGLRADLSGPALQALLEQTQQFALLPAKIVPDEQEVIAQALREAADLEQASLILTTGGTGFAPRDVTPEATCSVLEKLAPGIAEAMRYASLQITPHAMLSRAVAGIRKRSLIINLPGSPKAAAENLQAVLPALPHSLQLLRGDVLDCGQAFCPFNLHES